MQPLALADPAQLPLSARSAVFERLRTTSAGLVQRAPPADDATRWHTQRIGERMRRFALPLTFTPYASVQACSARCRFCSENLRVQHGGTAAATLRPGGSYFDALQRALQQLVGIPLSYSLSGLEMSDDPVWFVRLLRVLDEAASAGVRVEQRVLYSNGAGVARDRNLPAALQAFGLDWVELSRHHHDAVRNQAIMRFRDAEPIHGNAAFERIARELADITQLRMVCILQNGGIATVDDIARYIGWAADCGASTVIFREFSRLDDRYLHNGTRRYIDTCRVGIDTVLQDCMRHALWTAMTPHCVTEGYYFWNIRLRHASGIDVVFETSDYAAMAQRHASDAIYKLVFFANGRLCAGWQPDADILWDANDG